MVYLKTIIIWQNKLEILQGSSFLGHIRGISLVNWSEQSECAALGHRSQNVVATKITALYNSALRHIITLFFHITALFQALYFSPRRGCLGLWNFAYDLESLIVGLMGEGATLSSVQMGREGHHWRKRKFDQTHHPKHLSALAYIVCNNLGTYDC